MNGSNKNWKTQFFIPKGCNLDIVNKVVIKGKEFLPVVHGEWLDKSEGYYWFGKCSVCGTNFSIDGWYSENMNYCPNCGARMDEEVKSE